MCKTDLLFGVETKEAAKAWIENEGLVLSGQGWEYRGAGRAKVSKEWALENFNLYSFGMGFYELEWSERLVDGVKRKCLVMSRYSVCDME